MGTEDRAGGGYSFDVGRTGLRAQLEEEVGERGTGKNLEDGLGVVSRQPNSTETGFGEESRTTLRLVLVSVCCVWFIQEEVLS